jgi:hypothetical protein
VQNYRDSKGSLFKATLNDMLIQNVMHSTHHRAQIVNAIRRVGQPQVGNVIEMPEQIYRLSRSRRFGWCWGAGGVADGAGRRRYWC